MSRIKAGHAFAVAILALVAAIIVPAYAALTQGEKKTVKRLANAQITKRASGLSVASANSANTANTADSAATAGDADTLDGQDASDFTPADEVHNSGRVVLNDPNPGDNVAEFATILDAVSFSVEATCIDNVLGSGDDRARLRLEGLAGSSLSGVRTEAPPTQINDFAGPIAVLALIETNEPAVRGGWLTGVSPNGDVVTVHGSAEVNDPAGDCIFGVTMVGP